MAQMRINIINPSIDLIKGLRESANSCQSIFEWTIQSTPNATIKIFLTRGNNHAEDYEYAQIDVGTGYRNYSSGTLKVMGSTGTMKFRVIMGNAYMLNLQTFETDEQGNTYVSESTGNKCAITNVSVADITNQITEEVVLTRCNSSAPCDGLPKPTANDDEYVVEDGAVELLDVLVNDTSNSSLADLILEIDSQPTHGTIRLVNNKVEYTHTGSNNVTDTFTYHVVNDVGESSNIATVTITIPFKDETATIPYYPVTVHWAGSSWKSDRYATNPTAAFTEAYGVMLRKTTSDGTIRDTDIPNNTKIQDFLEDDIVHSTIPANQMKVLAFRYHRVDRFAVDINTTMPNVDKIRMRGNWANLGHWDLSNLTKLVYFDISMNFIHTLQLPPTGANDVNNNFTFAYLGHYERSDNSYDEKRPRPAEYENEAAPRQVVNILMRRAYYSNVPDSVTSAVETKRFNSQTSTGTLYYDGVNYHKLLIDRGWSIEHISTEEEVNFASSSAGSATLDFMTSHHNWDLVIPTSADWLKADKSAGSYSLDVQTITLSASANTTGAPRSTEVYLRKIKEYPRTTGKAHEDGTEFHYRAVITVTQP